MKDTVGDFFFDSDFDSGNLARVEKVEKCDNEFNLWTLPDCANTPYENGNRTWFYFSVKGASNVTVKFNIMNLNRQAKLYSQGMRPLFKITPNQENWERIKEKPITSVEEQAFILSFKFTMPSDESSTAFLAFCYPYSYSDLLRDLDVLDGRFASKDGNIFYKRELICRSLDEKNVDLLTITRNGDENNKDKPVVFVSARVHPGETPSSFVLKGFLNFILKEDDIRAQKLRENFIFLLVPMLNPDGVYRGHYRTDSRGVNLNRVYLETQPDVHPTIAATKQMLLQLTKEDLLLESNSMSSLEHQVKETLIMQTEDSICQEDSTAHWPTTFKDVGGPTSFAGLNFPTADVAVASSTIFNSSILEGAEEADVSAQNFDVAPANCSGVTVPSPNKSRLFAYIDLHGHASKRGIFIYGNHFKDPNQQVECLLFPKLISLNSQHFDFWACNFSEKNMRQRDKRDGLSKEGSGRVAVSKLTGITRSYTLECNYNTGRMRNILSPLPTDKFPLFHATTSDVKVEERLDGSTVTNRRRTVSAGPNLTDAFSPPVPYTEQCFEEVGEAMAVSLLDLIGANPLSRLTQSPYSDVDGVRQWIRLHCMGQRRFPFIGDAEDESSTGLSHQPPSSALKNEPPQQVVRRERPSSTFTADPIPSTSATSLSPSNKRSSSGNKTSLKSKATNRTRLPKPWPGGSPRLMKESLPQSSGASPKSPKPALDFAPTSPTYQLFPKQVRSPLSGRRVPRKKSLKKAKKIIVKKEVIDGTIDGIVELDGSSLLVPSPSQTVKLLKRKRRKSRSLSESNSKEKRRTTSLENQEIEDHIQPSTSRGNFQSKTTLVKKKKILKKRNSANVMQKKKRMSIGDYVMDA